MGIDSFKYVWVLDKLKVNMNMVSPMITPCGNSRPASTMGPSLSLQVTESLSKTIIGTS